MKNQINNSKLNKYPTYSPFPLDFRVKGDWDNNIFKQ